MSWQIVRLTFTQIEKGPGDQLANEIQEAFIAAGYPPKAAVFGCVHWTNKDGHYYFNPDACLICPDLLSRWGGITCKDPGPRVALLIGHLEAYCRQIWGEVEMGFSAAHSTCQ
jgi:hypothetical protein